MHSMKITDVVKWQLDSDNDEIQQAEQYLKFPPGASSKGSNARSNASVTCYKLEPMRKRLPLLWFWELFGSIVERARLRVIGCLSLPARCTARRNTR